MNISSSVRPRLRWVLAIALAMALVLVGFAYAFGPIPAGGNEPVGSPISLEPGGDYPPEDDQDGIRYRGDEEIAPEDCREDDKLFETGRCITVEP